MFMNIQRQIRIILPATIFLFLTSQVLLAQTVETAPLEVERPGMLNEQDLMDYSSEDANKIIQTWGIDGMWQNIVDYQANFPGKFCDASKVSCYWLARAQLELGKHSEAVKTYQQVFQMATLDQDEETRRKVLGETRAGLPNGRYVNFLERLLSMKLEKSFRREIVNILYPLWMGQLASALEQGHLKTAGSLLKRLDRMVKGRKDTDAARLLVSGYQKTENPEKEMEWLRRLVEWHGRPDDILNLAYAVQNRGDQVAATEWMQKLPQDNPGRLEFEAEKFSKTALQEYENKKYPESIAGFEAVSERRPLRDYEQLVQAWAYFQMEDYQEAILRFKSIYKVHKDEKSAEGLIYSEMNGGSISSLYAFAKEQGGPIARMLPIAEVENLQQQGYEMDTLALSSEENVFSVNAPQAQIEDQTQGNAYRNGWHSLHLGVGWLEHDGIGAGQYEELVLPHASLAGRFSSGHVLRLAAQKREVETANSGQDLLPYHLAIAASDFSYETRHDDTTWSLSLESDPDAEGWRYRAMLGQALLSDALDDDYVGELMFKNTAAESGWFAGFRRSQVRQSLVAYTGSSLSFSLPSGGLDGFSWGGVLRNTLLLTHYHKFGDGLGAAAEIQISDYEGTNTRDNESLQFYGNLAKVIRENEHSQIDIGMSYLYMGFDNNQNAFHPGVGGYFSPEDFHMLTLEGRWQGYEADNKYSSLILKLGYQTHNTEDIAGMTTDEQLAWALPAETSQTILPGGSANGPSAEFEYQGLYRLGESAWKLGAQFRWRYSDNFEDKGLMIFLQRDFSQFGRNWRRKSVDFDELLY